MSACSRNSSTGPPSPSPLYLTFDADPAAPAYKTVPITLANGKTAQARVCEICSRAIAIGSKGSLHAFNTHKSACEQKKGSSAAPYPPVFGSHTRSQSVTPSMTSLSPLAIPSPSLSPSLPGSPTSPLYSPAFSPTHSLFNIESDSEDRGAPAYPGTPLITVDPPSDGLGLLTPLPHLPVLCLGTTVQWTPGTIWETYPFASHAFVQHQWEILEIIPPRHLRLRSTRCTLTVSAGGFGSTCHSCLGILKSDGFQTIQKRAEGAPSHTPYRYLSFEQLYTIPKKMTKLLDQARIKVFDQGKCVRLRLT